MRDFEMTQKLITTQSLRGNDRFYHTGFFANLLFTLFHEASPSRR
ncbi:hypothetical protein ASZ90_008019 [hydrocarbon metagenome]|uniref:Uncharacterized protein n=1 Tax=hydrocarbon metagenome TaxID=938273 RepID=A0A0W8FMR8_9ZZZZ